MTGPGDRDDRDAGGWQEPPHLGRDGSGDPDDAPDQPNIADRRREPRGEGSAWTPPGWDLPSAERDVPAVERDASPEPTEQPEKAAEPPRPLPGARPERARGGGEGVLSEFQQTFAYQGDLVGAQGWALQHGWTISDGTAPEDAPLRDLVSSAPVRLSKDHRPAGVMRGRADSLDMVAFDVLYASGRHVVPEYAVTAVPLLTPVPYFRLAPARFWKHGVGGLLAVETGDAAFDARWVLFTAEDGPAVRALAADGAVRAMLLGTDDGDEFWAAAGHVAAIRPDGHRPALIEHHARLLTAVSRALSGGH
ncbi:MAG: hypothetical protein AVDCRST_MAG52-305 [uncultured Blastococcus sp.]|uniref:Uncharacterized protein n=1 Tax=uncultured Blastococcus sp. TaxID=217144 RepID=A0A6J4HBG3_9ACTN|nr:MAG: hypothetical protein AVDCRST_MAG52-305 [uncultured Blastococcus sp.]